MTVTDSSGKVTSGMNIKLPSVEQGVKGTVSTFDSVRLPVKDAFVIMKGHNGFGITLTDGWSLDLWFFTFSSDCLGGGPGKGARLYYCSCAVQVQ